MFRAFQVYQTVVQAGGLKGMFFSPKYFPNFLAVSMASSGIGGYMIMNGIQQRRYEVRYATLRLIFQFSSS
eukprot:scaffold82467_cov54-Attheya_sp.AAC.3